MYSRTCLNRMLLGGALSGILLFVVRILPELGHAGTIAAVTLAVAAGSTLTAVSAKWREQSMVDEGTGLFNRRRLFRLLGRELARAKRSAKPIAIAVVDVDDFKRFNTTYGHLGGDQVLRDIARVLRSGVRKGDMLGRWGGEEFAVVFPGSGIEGALKIAERLREEVEQHAATPAGAAALRPTVSIGVAASEAGELTLAELLAQADQAMYAAKARKNTVVPFSPARGA